MQCFLCTLCGYCCEGALPKLVVIRRASHAYFSRIGAYLHFVGIVSQPLVEKEVLTEPEVQPAARKRLSIVEMLSM